ncbi:hypothetical protein DFH28DRAFT_869675, partial [Melampsora americana]
MDPVVGTQQKRESYWNLIHENYTRFKEKLPTDSLRFAKELYQAETGDEFTYEHCWVILRNCDKWKDLPVDNEGQSSKKNPRKRAPPSSNVTSGDDSLDQGEHNESEYLMTSVSARPIGTKAAKNA